MKVLHYLKWMRKRDGGVVNCVMQLAPLQAAMGHHVALLTADASDVPQDTWRLTEPTHAFCAGQPACVSVQLRDRLAELRGSSAAQAERDTPTQLLTSAALAQAEQLIAACDIVHIHGPWSSSNLQVARIARRCKKPYVVSAHGMLDDWSMAQGAAKKRLFLRLFGSRMLDGALAVHCAAQAEAAQVAQHTHAPTRVVALPMDLAPYRDLPGPPLAQEHFKLRPHVPTLLFLSRLHPKKGAEHAIDALAALRAGGTDCDLILAGPPQDAVYTRTLEDRVKSLELQSHARFVGMVDGTLKLSLMQAAAALVLPTSQENFGFVLLESLACGTPVFTTKGVDLWSELEASGAGTIIEPTGEAIAQALRAQLPELVDTDRRANIAAHARAWVFGLLEPARLVREYEQMYRGLR